MQGYYLSFDKPVDGRYRHHKGRPLSPKDVKKREAYHKAGRFIAASELERTINEIKTLAGFCAEALLGRPNYEIYRGSREDIVAAEALINRGDINAISKKVGTLIIKKRKRVEKIAKALIKLDKQARSSSRFTRRTNPRALD